MCLYRYRNSERRTSTTITSQKHVFWRVNRATMNRNTIRYVCRAPSPHPMQMGFCRRILSFALVVVALEVRTVHTQHGRGRARCMSTAHLKQLIYFYTVHIISHFTILFVSVNDAGDRRVGDMCAHLTLVPEYISRLNV